MLQSNSGFMFTARDRPELSVREGFEKFPRAGLGILMVFEVLTSFGNKFQSLDKIYSEIDYLP